MAVIYSLSAINNRLLGVVTTIDAGPSNGVIVLLAGSTPVSNIPLQKPSGTVNGGVLTFTGPMIDPSAAGAGIVTTAHVTDSTGAVIISGFSVGIPGSDADIVISNGLSSTLVTTGQPIQVLAAQIIGS